MGDGDLKNARLAMERLEALNREHGLEPEGEDHFRHAWAWEAAGEPERPSWRRCNTCGRGAGKRGITRMPWT